MSNQIPRVEGANLHGLWNNQTVRLVGEVVQHGSPIRIRTADHTEVDINVEQVDSDVLQNKPKYIEIIGKVQNNSFNAMIVNDFGESFDLKTYGEMVKLTLTKYKRMFS